MLWLPLDPNRCRLICKVLLPSLLVAPLGFSDRILASVLGPLPNLLQAIFYGMQAASALGITVSLAMIVLLIFRDEK
ncbi:MAG: hypothetical protein L0Y72_26405 [Gemmataceae bacterium]|nr:hypothetical protein [Gemmataceae bacterium]